MNPEDIELAESEHRLFRTPVSGAILELVRDGAIVAVRDQDGRVSRRKGQVLWALTELGKSEDDAADAVKP